MKGAEKSIREEWDFLKVWGGKVVPVTERTTPHYLEMKHLCQEEVGVLIWIASRTRPDIAGSVSIAATLTTFNPDEGFKLIKGVWRYLAGTVD